MNRLQFISILILLISMGSQAQTNFTTTTFDLSTIGKQGWNFFPGYQDSNGDLVVKMGVASCEMSTDKSFTGTTYNYQGLSWQFDEIRFGNDLTFKNEKEVTFGNSIDAMKYAPVYGEYFNPVPQDIAGGVILSRPLTSDFMGTTIITPAVSFKGYQIAKSFVYGKVQAPAGKSFGGADLTNYYSCGENPVFSVLEKIDAKENKGEKWVPVYNDYIPNGGVILFGYSKDGLDETKRFFMLKQFNDAMEEVKRAELTFDYINALVVKELPRGNGINDYIIISQSNDNTKWGGKKVNVKPANFAEVIYFDGENFEVTSRSETTLDFTQWNIASAIRDKEGSVYLFGAAGPDNKTYVNSINMVVSSDMKMPGFNVYNNSKTLPNAQIAKIVDGKVAYLKGISASDVDSKSQTLTIGKAKAKSDPIFTTQYGVSPKLFIKNGQLIVTYQQFYKAANAGSDLTGTTLGEPDKGNMVCMVFDKSGTLLSHIVKPEESHSVSNEFFTADGNQMYWTTYDIAALNKLENEGGRALENKVPGTYAGHLHLVKVNLTTGKANEAEWLGQEEWAIDALHPVIADGKDYFVLSGRTLAKKAKDSELVLVKINK